MLLYDTNREGGLLEVLQKHQYFVFFGQFLHPRVSVKKEREFMQVFSHNRVQSTKPQFGRKEHIVVDEPPFFKKGVDRIPQLRVGVPSDEESRITQNSGFGAAMFVGRLHQIIRKFL